MRGKGEKKEKSVPQVANRGSRQIINCYSVGQPAVLQHHRHNPTRRVVITNAPAVSTYFSLPTFHSTRSLSLSNPFSSTCPSILAHTHIPFFLLLFSFPLPLTLLPPTHPHPTLTRPTAHWPFPLQPALRFHPIPARAPPIGPTVFRRPLPNPALPPHPLFSHPFPSYLAVHPQQQPPKLDPTIRFSPRFPSATVLCSQDTFTGPWDGTEPDCFSFV